MQNTWLMQVAENVEHDYDFHKVATVDISYDRNRPDKMVGDSQLVLRIADYLDRGLDFGLKNDAGSYVFFIRRQWMVTFNPHDSNQNAVFDLTNTHEFENRLKVAVLFHPEFVSPAMCRLNPAYDHLTRGLLT